MPAARLTSGGGRPDPVRRNGAVSAALHWIWPGKPVVPLTVLVILLTVSAIGIPYYVAPIGECVRHPLPHWLDPSGTIGGSAGFLTFLLLVFPWLYRLRKKFRWLSFTGSAKSWLDVHVLAGSPRAVIWERNGQPRKLPTGDDVIIRNGGEPPFRFLQKIGVRLMQKDVPLPGVQASGG